MKKRFSLYAIFGGVLVACCFVFVAFSQNAKARAGITTVGTNIKSSAPVFLAAGPGCEDGACIMASARLASVDSSRGVLINALFSNLLGGSLSLDAVEWNHLATVDLSIGDLFSQLETDLTLSSTSEVLNANITLEEFLTAAATVADNDGKTAAAAALNKFETSIPGVTETISLGDFLEIELFNDTALNNTSVSLLDLLNGVVSLYNYDHVASTPTPVTVSGADLGIGGSVAEMELYAQVIEPPVLICGEEGETFHTAQIRIKLDTDLVDQVIPLDVSGVPGADAASLTLADMNLYLEVAKADGTLSQIDAVAESVDVDVTPGVVDIYWGTINDSVFFNRSHELDSSDVDFGTIGSLTVDVPILPDIVVDIEAKGNAQGENPSEVTLNFSGPWPETQTANTAASFVTDFVSDLFTQTEVNAEPDLGVGLDDVILPLVLTAADDNITPVVSTIVDNVFDPTLEVMGTRLGEVDVTVLSSTEVCLAYDVGVTIESDDLTVEAGTTSTITITASSNEVGIPTDISISHNSPSGTTILSPEALSGTYDSGTDTWSIPSLSSSTTLVFEVLFDEELADETVVLSATVDSINETDNNSSNDDDEISIELHAEGEDPGPDPDPDPDPDPEDPGPKKGRKHRNFPPPEKPPREPGEPYIYINDDDLETSNKDVTLTFFDAPTGTVRLILSNNPEFNTSTEIEFVTSTPWDLCFGLEICEPGDYYLTYARFIDENGEILHENIVWDDIFYVGLEEEIPCIDCEKISYNFYITNPNGELRMQGTDAVIEEELNVAQTFLRFEDSGVVDNDYNDYSLLVSVPECQKIIVDSNSVNAGFHHRVGVQLFVEGELVRDITLWTDSHESVGERREIELSKFVNMCNVPNEVFEEDEQPFVPEDVQEQEAQNELPLVITDENSLSGALVLSGFNDPGNNGLLLNESCNNYLSERISSEANNNPEQVLRLQTFLRVFEQAVQVPLSGIYDAVSFLSVVTFQEKYQEDVLAPWGLTQGTGNVFTTTLAKINELNCNKLREERLSHVKNIFQSNAQFSCPYFSTYPPQGSTSAEVGKIQDFLKALGYYTNEIDSVYSANLTSAVSDFQADYSEDTLSPWGEIEPTGRWFITTRETANGLLGCEDPA